jgi:uncharacterized membrane protein
LRSSLYCDVRQRCYRRFGRIYQSHNHGSSRHFWTLEDGAERLTRNAGNHQSKPPKTRGTKALIYMAAEACNHEQAIYLKNALSSGPLKNITVGHLIQYSKMFDGTRNFVDVFKRLICWCLSSEKSIHHLFSFLFAVILHHLCLRLPRQRREASMYML